jgi:hypothetical protein
MALSMNELQRRRRARNWALGGVLLGLVLIFYLVTVVRIGLHQ